MTVNSKTAVALGSFDGLHKGHKSVIACALSKKERGLIPTVLLFDSHPLLTLTGKAPETIQQDSLRSEMLENMGIKAEYISFSDIRDYSPREFFENIIIKKLNAASVCCGKNYRFGKNGAGSCEILSELCSEYGLEFNEVDLVEYENQPISSTRIREAIEEGKIPEANEMLGYEFSYRAEVIHGSARGKPMGIPTINQHFDKGFVIPKTGVYASVTTVEGVEYPSVTNIGLRPTFENEDLRSETLILGFDKDIYGEIIEVKLLEYIRSETKFDNLNELTERISLDSQISEEIFRKRSDGLV